MSKREKIILAIMTLVIVGGVIYYISSKREVVVQERESELKELNTFVGVTITNMNKNNLTAPEMRAIASAEVEWVRDPYRAPIIKEEEKQKL
jgi:hypothetical protein